MKAVSVLISVCFVLLVTGCYHNPRTWVERNGHLAYQYHVNGHGWTEHAHLSVIDCDWVDLYKSSIDGMEYCPPKRRGTETVSAQAFDSEMSKILPAAIHGLAFVAGMGLFSAFMPATEVMQVNSITGSGIKTSTLVLPGGAVPPGVAK
jgi:hypothetical protein